MMPQNKQKSINNNLLEKKIALKWDRYEGELRAWRNKEEALIWAEKGKEHLLIIMSDLESEHLAVLNLPGLSCMRL